MIRKSFKYFGIQNAYFKGLGLDVSAAHNKGFVQNGKLFALNMFSFIFMMIAYMRFIIKNSEEIDEITEQLAMIFSGSLSIVKLMLFWLKVDKFRILKKQSEELHKKMNVFGSQQWLQHNERDQFYLWWFNISCLLFYAVTFSTPFLTALYDYIKFKSFSLDTPYSGTYPFDHSSPLNYVVIFLINVLFSCYMRNVVLGMDGLFSWFVFSTSAHFRVLNEHLAIDARELGSEHTLQELEQIIRYHQKIIALMKALGRIFSPIIFAQISFCSFETCFYIYMLRSSDSFLMQVSMALAIVGLMMEFAYYCFGGEKLQNESEAVSVAIYSAIPWATLRPESRRLILSFLMQAQSTRPLIGFFFAANRRLFIAVLKTAFTLATFMKTVN